jgi:16S rRNA (cytidine1402-2'-O)-methyltransferase
MSLYIVATPLGNLKDISERSLEVLRSVDLILAEDTRRTLKLLSHFNIFRPLESFHEYSSFQKLKKILGYLRQGKELALVTDAGTPGISDPGAWLVSQVYALEPKIKVIPVPGPSAAITALSASGFLANRFCFWGYAPKKGKARKDFFQTISECRYTQVFFSTPHRVLKDLTELYEVGLRKREVFVAREMTKIHESFYRGPLEQVLDEIKLTPQKGEYTVVIGPEAKKIENRM